MFDSKEIQRRRDMRDVLTFTIDPADAKDFDDALSFERIDGGFFRIGVHIADVTWYVRAGEDTDIEAYRRGTSVYLVDRVIPMLPEELCNDRCSLRPGEDKLCMSVIFTVSPDAVVSKFKICRTVIRSDFRLSYAQAQDIIDGVDTGSCDPGLADALVQLNGLAGILRRHRMEAGALELENDEVKFLLDGSGHPVSLTIVHPAASNRLIEEFMLLANRTVAEQLGRTGKTSVWRVHDRPDTEKLEGIERFKKSRGDSLRPEALYMLTVRAMAKAVYSTRNIGHYGLAFTHYTHFTSPIRRYPDMMVHRLVSKYILGERHYEMNLDLQEACEHCSDCEQEAVQAERDSLRYMQALWMKDHMDETFTGIISCVRDFGIFVTLDGCACDGMVSVRDLCPGWLLDYDERNFCIRAVRPLRKKGLAERLGNQTGQCFTLGDPVTVRVVSVDVEQRHVNLELVQS